MKKLSADIARLIAILKEKYPQNEVGDDYFPLIKYLYDELCDEYLVAVISLFSQKPPHEIENDIYQSCTMKIDISAISTKLNIDFGNL